MHFLISNCKSRSRACPFKVVLQLILSGVLFVYVYEYINIFIYFFNLYCELYQTYKIVENGPEDMGRGKVKLGRSERVALTYTHYQR